MNTGIHLLLDCQCREASSLADLKLVYDLLERIPVQMGMTVVVPPIVIRFPHAASELERFAQRLRDGILIGDALLALAEVEQALEARRKGESGISGFSVIAESHLSIHTWPERSYFAADFFSCKRFDTEPVIDLLDAAFGIDRDRSEIQVVRRGLDMLPPLS